MSYVPKLQKWSNYKSNQSTMNCIDLTSKRSKNVEWRHKTFKTTHNYKTDQITMNCIDLMSKRSKQPKTTNAIKLRSICIDLTSKQSKTLRYGRKTFKTTQNYKLSMTIASIWHQNNPKCWDTSQNIQNNANQRKWSNYNALHRFDV